MAAAVTSAPISVGNVYVSLGSTQATSGMLISPEGEIEIVAAASQPAATVVGHPLGMSSLPFNFPAFGTITQVWALSVTGAAVNVVVTL
jgi:hypothetical protein